MTITIKNNHKYRQDWKGLHYGKTPVTDQIAIGTCQASTDRSHRGARAILASIFTARFYSSTNFRNPGIAAVLWNRLSRDSRSACGLIGSAKSTFVKQAAALYHLAEGTAQAFKKSIFQGLLTKIFDNARAIGLIKTQDSCACIDSTGLEDHFVSRHFIMRQNGCSRRYRRWTKLTIVCHNKTHLIAGALVSKGPSTDCHNLEPTVGQALDNITIDTLLADCGYDSEANHRLCRDRFGISSPVIAVNPRNLKYGSMTGHFRRLMKSRFPKKKYRQRWQVESIFSRFKRKLGYALRARTDESRQTECFLRVLTYNLMVVLLTLKRAIYQSFSTKQSKNAKVRNPGGVIFFILAEEKDGEIRNPKL
jgi:transposase